MTRTFFPQLMFQILEQADAESSSYDHVVSWNADGRSFKIHNRCQFMETILPAHGIQQSRYKSFVRQLNLWGFRCIHGGRKNAHRGSYYHPCFVRDEPEKLKGIRCIKKRRRNQVRDITKEDDECSKEEDDLETENNNKKDDPLLSSTLDDLLNGTTDDYPLETSTNDSLLHTNNNTIHVDGVSYAYWVEPCAAPYEEYEEEDQAATTDPMLMAAIEAVLDM